MLVNLKHAEQAIKRLAKEIKIYVVHTKALKKGDSNVIAGQ